jgi:hypothetical protein
MKKQTSSNKESSLSPIVEEVRLAKNKETGLLRGFGTFSYTLYRLDL